MSLAGYVEEFIRPVAKAIISGVGKFVHPPIPRLLSRICSKVKTLLSEWT